MLLNNLSLKKKGVSVTIFSGKLVSAGSLYGTLLAKYFIIFVFKKNSKLRLVIDYR